jgi:hypothetical protein
LERNREECIYMCHNAFFFLFSYIASKQSTYCHRMYSCIGFGILNFRIQSLRNQIYWTR